VGKTTLLLQLAREFGEAAVYVAGDEPGAALPGFWERSWQEAEARAQRGAAVLLLDEIHHLADWASRLKGQWDRLRRQHIPLHVVATGSSALRVATGSRESLAGRFERITLSHWPAAALAGAFHLSPQDAALTAVQFGCYPGTMAFRNDLPRWRAYVRDAIIEPAIGRDVLALGAIRRPALLRQVFAISAASPAQIVSLQKLQGQLQEKGALETVAHHLAMLQEAYLIAPLEKFSAHAHRRRSAPPKLVTLNNALLSAMHPGGPPGDEPSRFGAWVENACLAFALNQGQSVTYWREEPLEVDGVLQGDWGNWAVEVKTGNLDMGSFTGLLEFCRRYPRFTPLVIVTPGAEDVPRRYGIRSTSWQEFLLSGPPTA
jgi:predicted AAA+ superfamily ATPase